MTALRSDALPPVHECRKHEQEPQNRKREGHSPRFHAIPRGEINGRHDAQKNDGYEQTMQKHKTVLAETTQPQNAADEALAKADPNGLSIHCPNGEQPLEQLSRQVIGPRVSAALTNGAIAKCLLQTDLDLTATRLALREAADRIKAGDLSDAESLLYSQATSLNLLFAEMTRRALNNFNGDGRLFEAAKGYMGIALKAQAQCSRTLETLGSLKNPQTIFAKQANINNGGQQQINNAPRAPASKSEIQQDKVLERPHEERMDTPAQSKTGEGNPALEAMGAGYRSKDD